MGFAACRGRLGSHQRTGEDSTRGLASSGVGVRNGLADLADPGNVWEELQYGCTVHNTASLDGYNLEA